MTAVPGSLWVRLPPKAAAEFWEHADHLRRAEGRTWRWLAFRLDEKRGVGPDGGNTYNWLRKHRCDARKGRPLGLEITDAVLIADILGHHVDALDDALGALDEAVARLLGHPIGGEP